MLAKTKLFSGLYILVAVVIGIIVASGLLGTIIQQAGIDPENAGLFGCLALLATGIVAALFGGHKKTIVVSGITFSFCLLVANEQPLLRYLTLAALLFVIGVYGMVVSRNAVRMLMSIELMLNAVNINLVALSRYMDPLYLRGQLFAIFVLTIAAAEAAVGLAIVLSIYRNSSTIDMERFDLLKW
jgi:NAD(P)H-quinone oxidoreductase subunit 4L